MTTISTDYRYRCDEHAGVNEALSACGVHPIYQGDVIAGAYHETGGLEDGRIVFEDDNSMHCLDDVAALAARVHGDDE